MHCRYTTHDHNHQNTLCEKQHPSSIMIIGCDDPSTRKSRCPISSQMSIHTSYVRLHQYHPLSYHRLWVKHTCRLWHYVEEWRDNNDNNMVRGYPPSMSIGFVSSTKSLFHHTRLHGWVISNIISPITSFEVPTEETPPDPALWATGMLISMWSIMWICPYTSYRGISRDVWVSESGVSDVHAHH